MTAEATDPQQPSWADALALVARLDESGYAEADIEIPGLRVRVSRTCLSDGATAPRSVVSDGYTEAGGVTGPEKIPSGRATPVEAPMPGVVYWRPAADAEPYVAVGSEVSPDTTIAILEVMKMMNPVTAGVTGTVVEICVPDEHRVELGDPLILVDTGRRQSR